MKNKNIFHLFYILIILTFISCSKTDSVTNPEEGGNNNPLIIKLAEASEKVMNDSDKLLSELLKTTEKTKAIDSVVSIIKKDTSVSFCEKNSQGIMIQYKSGIKGGIFLDPEDSLGFGMGNTSNAIVYPLMQKPNIIPGAKKTIFINPHYLDRIAFANPIMALYNNIFPKVGFNQPVTFLDTLATIDVFSSLAGYGIVHIYSHGWAWPNKKSITEVYLMTGENVNNATTQKYSNEITSGNIPLVKIHNGSNKYFISPDFFASKNNFEKDSTIVYGGFCYGFLGTWPQKIINNSKALDYTGFTWRVLTSWNANWAKSLFDTLSNKTYKSPMTIENWFSNTPAMAKQYMDPEDNVTVKIQYSGRADLALWGGVRIDSLSPNHGKAGTVVSIFGKNFGTSSATGSITFSGVQAAVQNWSDTKITATVPTGIESGFVIVKNGTDESNKVYFTIDSEMPVFNSISINLGIKAVNKWNASGTLNGRDTTYGKTDTTGFGGIYDIPITMSGNSFSGSKIITIGASTSTYLVSGSYDPGSKTINVTFDFSYKGIGIVSWYSSESSSHFNISGLPLSGGEGSFSFGASELDVCNYFGGGKYSKVEKPIAPNPGLTFTYNYTSFFCVKRTSIDPYGSYLGVELKNN